VTDAQPLSSIDLSALIAPEQRLRVEQLSQLTTTHLDSLIRLCRLATCILGIEQSSVGLVADREIMLVQYSVNEGKVITQTGVNVPLEDSFCRFTVLLEQPFVVTDAIHHPLTQAMPCVEAGEIRAYLGVPLRLEDGQVVGTLCVYGPQVHDFTPTDVAVLEDLAVSAVTELALYEERCHLVAINQQLRHALNVAQQAALRCPLTQLLNRTGILAAIAERLTPPIALPVMVLFIDLDGFKHINDSFGHAVGDALLATVGERLQRIAQSSNAVARLGGDEFLVLTQSLSDKVEALVAQIRTELVQPYAIGPYALTIGVSIGVASTQEPIDAAQLIEQADQAMYADKRQQRCRNTSP
jgi:diguanylate cyclase (GGDEF)-like protein